MPEKKESVPLHKISPISCTTKRKIDVKLIKEIQDSFEGYRQENVFV